MIYEIDNSVLDYHLKLTSNKYGCLFSLLETKLNEKNKTKELTDLVIRYARRFGATLESVEKKFLQDPILKLTPNADDIVIMYSANIAAQIVCKDIETNTNKQPPHNSLKLDAEQKTDTKIVSWGETNYNTVKLALEGLIDSIIDSKSPVEAITDYFYKYNNKTNEELESKLNKDTYSKISEIKWKIGSYQIDGIKTIIRAENGKSITNINVQEKSQFYTSLEYINVPKSKVLSKNKIIGDKDILTHLENMMKCLFLYNPNKGKNPMTEKGLFDNKIILAGPPGEGKTTACFYAINYAEELSKRLGADLLVTSFDIDTSYKRGAIQKLKSQISQIQNSNRPIIIFQDEIDGLLKEDASNMQDRDDNDIIQEFKKFLDGQYEDNGKYLFLGTVNNILNLKTAQRSRFTTFSWDGASTKEQKSQLFLYKLEEGIKKGYITLEKKELEHLGQLAYQNKITGRDITKICKLVTSDNFRWNGINEIYDSQADYEAQLNKIDGLFNNVSYSKIELALTNFARNRNSAAQYALEQ